MCETPIRNKLLLKTKSLSIPPSPLMQTLGYGTGVTVYKLERSRNQSPWVLKKISRRGRQQDEMNTRLKFEAEILKTLKHPNIVGFRAFITEPDGRKCIAMEDCNISLGDLIEKRVDDGIDKPFPAMEIQKVADDIAQGLKYLHHEALVLHCDMKSYNILVKDNFSICKICDFGVSMPLNPDGTLDVEKAGEEAEYVGTTVWCPPEVFHVDKKCITNKADIYAYGLCLWEMIGLQPPPMGDDSSRLDHTVASDEVVEISTESESESDKIIEISDSEDDSDAEVVGKLLRPKIPCKYLDDSYLGILQIYYLCTEYDYQKRPNAIDLCNTIKEICNLKGEE